MAKSGLENIILIDDKEVSNFFNKITLLNMGIAKNIQIFDNSLEALNFLKSNIKKNSFLNNIIFLDLYTPFMNGWEFLDNLKEISVNHNIRVLVMQGSGLLPEEEVKLYQYSFVKSIINKHLKEAEVLKAISGKKNINRLKMIS